MGRNGSPWESPGIPMASPMTTRMAHVAFLFMGGLGSISVHGEAWVPPSPPLGLPGIPMVTPMATPMT